MMTEFYTGIRDRPVAEHAAFMVEFAERYPNYPDKHPYCPCAPCLIARTKED